MEDYLNRKGLCQVCKEELTTMNAEMPGGQHIFVCEKCLETAKLNFIWICMHCGGVYIRPKTLVLRRLRDPELKQAYQQCADLQIIQGIERCIECDPEEIVQYVAAAKCTRADGHC